MEDQENLTPSQMLTLIQEMLVNNARAVENLESAERELDISRDKCNDNLNNHYDLVTKMLKEVYQSGAEEVATQYETKKEDLKRKMKYLTRCSLALMPELDNLRSSGPNAVDAAQRCKDILAKLTKVRDLQKAEPPVTFNFIPKIGKLKLGFLQLCNDLPQDFTLRLLTPIMNIRLGQQIDCGIEGNLTAENVHHLEFGIRRNNDLVPSQNLATQGEVFKFGFKADLGGVYVILACLFGTPIAHSPLTLTIHVSDSPPPAARALASHVEVSSPPASALASHVDVSSPPASALASHVEVSSPVARALASYDDVPFKAVEFKGSEAAEGDYDEISGPVQEADLEKTSSKIVQEMEVKSPMGLEYALAHKQIKDDRNTDVNRNSKNISLGSVNAEENNVIKESTKTAKVNNNDLPGARFKVGDECVALGKDGMWYNGLIEATNSDGSFHVKFVDYGNSGNIALDDIVKSAPDIPEDVPDYDVDDNVGSRVAKKDQKDSTFRKKSKENYIEDIRKFGEGLDTNKNVDKSLSTKDADNDHSPSRESKVFQVGDVCVAKWSEDQVWYNGIVKNSGKDGSYNVIFTDYGNNDDVNEQFIIKDASAIPPGEYVDENVNVNQIVSRNLSREGNNETSYEASQAEENFSKKESSGVTKKVEASRKTLSAPDQATSSSEKAAVPVVMKTVIPECGKFGDVGDKENSKDGRENKDLQGSLGNVKTETLIKKRRNKSKPPVPRPLESNLGTKLNAAPMLQKTEESRWKAGETCLAKWSEDGVWYRAVVDSKETQFSQDGSFEVLYNVTFTDYGNKDQVRASQMVKDHKELIKSGVGAIFDGNVKVDFNNAIDGNRLWKIGEIGIARWAKDNIWYNAKIKNVNVDGSLEVIFVDYGNTDTVKMPFFVKNTSMIEDTGEEIMLDVNIDVHGKDDIAVNKKSDEKIVTNKEFPTNSDSPSHFPLPITSSNTPVDVNREFIYPDVEEKAFPSSNVEKTEDLKSSKTSGGSTFSGRSLAFKSDKTKFKPFNILKHVTTTKEGRQEMVIKCVLKVSENISSPIGMTILPNKSVIIGSSLDDCAKILRPDGSLLAPINSVRQFVKPTDMATLSTGEFVIRDDLGLQLFSEDGVYVKSCGTKQIDKCFGLAEDEGGNIITINWAQPSRSSKPGSKGNGGLTDVGETDVFFISRETGEVVKRIELTDIISDKIKSKCRFLRYHNNTLYIVDIGLDCIYKLKTDCNEVSIVGGTGTGPNKFRDPAGIVVDDFGNFIVADSKNHRLQIFGQDENFIGFVAVDLPIRRPSGIFLDKEQGELYILNYWGNNSMVKYRVSGSRD